MNLEKRNMVQYPSLPEELKAAAMEKALKIGYNKKEATRLWFNVLDNKLAEGVVDRDYFQKPGSPFRI